MGLPEAGMCPRLPRHFREQVVASEDQGHEEPTWTSLGDSDPLSCFYHPCLPHPVSMLQKKKKKKSHQATQGVGGLEGQAPGQSSDGGRPKHRALCLRSPLEDKEEGEGTQEGLERAEEQPGC